MAIFKLRSLCLYLKKTFLVYTIIFSYVLLTVTFETNYAFAEVSDFEKSLKFTLNKEGGYSDDLFDLGGKTNLGVTQDFYDEYLNYKGLPQKDVKYISYNEAYDLYLNLRWKKVNCDRMAWPLNIVMFDTAVNFGPYGNGKSAGAIKFLQKAVDLPADGGWGPQTEAAFSKIPVEKHKEIALKIMEMRKNWRYEFVEIMKSSDKPQDSFLEGWLKRDNDLINLINGNNGGTQTQQGNTKSQFQQESTLLKLGNTGERVSQLQEMLIKLGYLTGNVDGIYGNMTENAVKAFQKEKGLLVDGIVGEQTWSLLEKAVKALTNEIKNKESKGNLTYKFDGDNVFLTWAELGSNTKYDIYRSDNGGKFSKLTDFQLNQPNFTDKHIQDSHTYSYKFVTLDNYGNINLESDPVVITISNSTNQSTSLKYKVEDGNKVKLIWLPVSNEKTYDIYRSDNGGNFVKLTDFQLTQPSFIDRHVIKGHEYYYKYVSFDSSQNVLTRSKPIKVVLSTKEIKLQLGNKKAYINDQNTELESAPVVVNGRTLVPVRFIGEALGANVDWNGTDRSVSISLENNLIIVRINDLESIVNGVKVYMDVPPQIIDDITMVPLRFIGESLNKKVTFNNETSMIKITD